MTWWWRELVPFLRVLVTFYPTWITKENSCHPKWHFNTNRNYPIYFRDVIQERKLLSDDLGWPWHIISVSFQFSYSWNLYIFYPLSLRDFLKRTTFFYLFCIAGEGSSTFLNFVKGDLILLDEDTSGEAVLTSGWCTGTCERTEERGDFPAEVVYVLPCLSRPPDDILVRITNLYPIFPLWSL